MSQPVVFIQGGGLGLQQEQAVREVLRAAGVACDWQVFPAGGYALEQGLEALPGPMLAAVRQARVAVKTKLLSPPGGKHPNYNVALRKELGLFAAVRPIHNVRGLPARFQEVNILLVREITEDLYTAIEHEIVPGVVQSIKVVTDIACRRFFRFAFQLARAQGRKTIHCIHKANILKLADGLFLECFRQTAQDFPEIAAKEMIVDNACMQLVSRPQQFDVIVTGNLYGDLLSDLGAGLVGGITAADGINHGDGIRVFECIHGGPATAVAPGHVNPLPLLFTVLEMLSGLGQGDQARRIQAAVEEVLLAGYQENPDFGLHATTQTLVERVCSRLR